MTHKTSLFTIAIFLTLCLSASNARFLSTSALATTTPDHTAMPSNWPVNVTWSTSLGCGLCTLGGYVYCVLGNENQAVSTLPSGYCCKNSSNCTYANLTTYNCTSSYGDMAYGLWVCPNPTTQCGTKQSVFFNTIGNSTNVTVATGLAAGNVCIYTIRASCGAPAFKTSNNSQVTVGYMYYETGSTVDLSGTTVTGKVSNDSTKMMAPPATLMPRRNQTFYIEDGYKPMPMAVKGIYNVAVGGIRAYGNAVQSDSALGTKLDSSTGTCVTNRTMHVSVIAQSTTTSAITVTLMAANFSDATLPVKSNGGGDGECEGDDCDESFALNFSSFLGITFFSIIYFFY